MKGTIPFEPAALSGCSEAFAADDNENCVDGYGIQPLRWFAEIGAASSTAISSGTGARPGMGTL